MPVATVEKSRRLSDTKCVTTLIVTASGDTLHRQRGFTLVEVLVSLAILSVVLVALYGSMGAAANRLSVARSESVAATIAQSKLEEVGKTIPAVVGDTEGKEGDYEWTISIQIVGTPEERVNWPAVLVQIAVEVHWGDVKADRTLRMVTMKLLAKGGG